MAKRKQILEKAKQSDIDFFCNWRYPVCLAECLWHDVNNMGSFDENLFGNIFLYQHTTLSWEWMQDLDNTDISDREKMNAKKMCSDMYYLGARNIGKSKVALEMDMPMTFQYEKNGKSLFSSINENKIKNITDPVKKILEKHPWFIMFGGLVEAKQQTFKLENNNYEMNVINMNVGSKDPGDHFYGKHSPRIFVEEFSLEPSVVYEKRKDSTAPYGSVVRCISKGSDILMANGKTTKIEDIEVGDFVFALNKNNMNIEPSMVKATLNNGIRDTISIKNSKKKLYLTPDHNILAEFGFGPEWIESQDVECEQTIKNYNVWSKKGSSEDFVVKKSSVHIELQTKNIEVYDIETEHGNFIANGFVVHNCSGMTNFTRHSPSGIFFHDKKYENQTINLPQMVSPFWSEEKKQEKIKEYSGETTVGFRVFVDGEVVEDGDTLLDMERVRNCYKEIPYKLIEIDKKKYNKFNGAVENLIHLSKPKNVKEIYIAMDVGVTGISEMIIVGRVKEKFRLLYNIRVSGLKVEEKLKCIEYVAEEMNANIIALDTNEGQGSALADLLEIKYGVSKIFRFKGTFNIPVSKKKDDNGKVIRVKGKIQYNEERMATFGVLKLQKMLYDELFEIPKNDLKFDGQMSQVVAKVSKSSGKVLYDCIAQENHYFDTWKILVTVLHKIELIDSDPIKKSRVMRSFNI